MSPIIFRGIIFRDQLTVKNINVSTRLFRNLHKRRTVFTVPLRFAYNLSREAIACIITLDRSTRQILSEIKEHSFTRA